MKDLSLLKPEERISLSLRTLYRRYGFFPYKMSKFEEYDFYARNKDFLQSDNIITFTDLNGRLMALKPDVTLSIIRSTREEPGTVRKVCYNEHVYRPGSSSRSFREILQVGLECIGSVVETDVAEVLLLAAESLRRISESFVLNLSDQDVLRDLLDRIGAEGSLRKELLRCIGEKNLHELQRLCQSADISAANASLLRSLASLSGSPARVLARLEELNIPGDAAARLRCLTDTLAACGYSEQIRIDFSVIGNQNYYNGIIFKGYVAGIPEQVLSGGQYDLLMDRLHRKEKAIGFAVYLDTLERLEDEAADYDVDILLLYEPSLPVGTVIAAARSLTADGSSILLQKEIPQRLRYRRLAKLTESGVHWNEDNA